MSRLIAPAGYRGTDERGRHQWLTCWGWKHPAIHSCPGVPQPGRTPPPAPRRIQRRRIAGWRMPEGAVYVGRPTKWGNPYALGRAGWAGNRWLRWYVEDTRVRFSNLGEYDSEAEAAERAVALFRAEAWLISADIRRELAGRDLVCWCAVGQPCHADVLLELAAMDVAGADVTPDPAAPATTT